MSESSQPSDRLSRDPVRVVYHTENRTFARLFNERTLEEVRDVVRRKLGLGRETDISLKQIRPDALLDLEDDDDFQAFRVFLKTSFSVDIQVTVGKSKGAPVPPAPAAPQATEPSAALSMLPPEEPAVSATAGQSGARPEVPRTTKGTPVTMMPSTSLRKRKVSFDNAPIAAPGDAAEQGVQSNSATVTPVSTSKVSKTAQTSAAPKVAGAEEPLKKKHKKVKAKDAERAEGVESGSLKTSGTLKAKVKKSAVLDRESETGASTPRDSKTSEPATKKPKKPRKDESTVSKKPSAPDPEGADPPTTQPSISVNNNSVQIASERPKGDVSKARQLDKMGVCASIPRTSASATVQSEVAAAIWSDYLSKSMPPPPPAKRKSIGRDTKRSSTTSNPSLAISATDHPANESLNVLAGPSPRHVVPTNEPSQQARELDSPPCPICLAEPFHIRYRCPIVLKGPDAIQERLAEVKRMNGGDHSLIKELEGLLRDSEVTTEPSLTPVLPRDLQPLSASVSRTSNIPSSSRLSEVTVESRDEGSSSDSSDDIPAERAGHKEGLTGSGKQKTTDKPPSPPNDDLEAVMRGPVSKRQSVLRAIAHILESGGDEDSDSGGNEAELEEDLDEETGRSPILSSKYKARSSDSEGEEEESRSSSPPYPAEVNLEPGISGSNKSLEKPTEHQGDDAVTEDHVNPPLLGGRDDDSSEETHVGSEDRMVVDDPIGEKVVATAVEERVSPPLGASVLHPSNASGDERREGGELDVRPTSNPIGTGPTAFEGLNEAGTDPIEPADDLEPPTNARLQNADPIEVLSEEIGSLLTGVAQSTPHPGVTKRIKTRSGQILDDEAERPVLLQELAPMTTEEATPLSTKAKLRKKVAKTPAGQEPVTTRKSPRFGSLPPSTSTPAAVVLLNHRTKSGTRSGKATKTPAKRFEERRTGGLQNSTKDTDARHGARVVSMASLNNWETLAESSSSSLQLDEPSVQFDELKSSSPQLEDNPVYGPLNASTKTNGLLKSARSSGVETPQGRERLFDLSSSQIPFPYSQHKEIPMSTNGKEYEVTTDSEEGANLTKKRGKLPVRYRSLSHLASQATLFPPSLLTPASKSVTDGKAKKRVASNVSSSSSSSSSDEDEAGGSEHIPRGRMAGSALDMKKKSKSLLSKT